MKIQLRGCLGTIIAPFGPNLRKFYYYGITSTLLQTKTPQGSRGNLEKSGRLRSLYAFFPSFPSSVP